MKNFTFKSVNLLENNFKIAIKGNRKALLKYTELSEVLNSILILLITNVIKVCIFRGICARMKSKHVHQQ